jgi:hypothetical protein
MFSEHGTAMISSLIADVAAVLVETLFQRRIAGGDERVCPNANNPWPVATVVSSASKKKYTPRFGHAMRTVHDSSCRDPPSR